MKFALPAALALLLTIPAQSALAYRTINTLVVNPVSDTVFEVIGRVGSGPVQYWCSAGDYARQVLNTSATQRIYLWRALGPGVTEQTTRAVQFSVTPPPDADTTPSFLLSVTNVGDNMSSAAAHQYCLGTGAGQNLWRRG